MRPFTVHTGTIAVYAADNVDTDRIIPARFLTMVTKSGYGELLFKDVRGPEFPLDQPAAAGASVLVAGSNFGCGSSREHAVWAIQQAGFRAVIGRRDPSSEGFSDIFRQNAANCGLLLVELDPAQHAEVVSAGSGVEVTIDLPKQVVRVGGKELHFDIRPAVKDALVKGLDLIGTTLENEAAIEAYEMRDRLSRSAGGARGSRRTSRTQKLWLGMALIVAAGCSAKAPPPAKEGDAGKPPVKQASMPSRVKGGPGYHSERLFQLPQLATVDIRVGGHKFKAWLMNDFKKREEGFMFIEPDEVKADQAMIFAFLSPEPQSFWMRDCPMALDIAFFGPDKRLLNVGYGQPFSEAGVPSSGPAQYVVEVKAGTFKRLRIKPGAKLETPASVRAVE